MPDRQFSAGAHHRDVCQAEIVHDFLEPDHPAFQRLDQGQLQVRTGDGQAKSRKSGSASDVGNMAAVRDFAFDDGTVQDVPAPQPWDLARADQPALGSGRGQVLNVAFGQVQAVTEDLLGRLAVLLP